MPRVRHIAEFSVRLLTLTAAVMLGWPVVASAAALHRAVPTTGGPPPVRIRYQYIRRNDDVPARLLYDLKPKMVAGMDSGTIHAYVVNGRDTPLDIRNWYRRDDVVAEPGGMDERVWAMADAFDRHHYAECERRAQIGAAGFRSPLPFPALTHLLPSV